MFEDEIFSTIMNRCLERVSSEVDKREGSIIYDALAPAVLELVNMYISLDIWINEVFADTASREYLILRAKERGLEPYAATAAVVKARFNTAVDLGTEFNLGTVNYTVTELIDDTEHTYKLQCNEAGEVGNAVGKLTPIEYVEGLTSAVIEEILIYGEETEETEDFRQRYFDSLNTQAFGGNVADYKQKVKSQAGIGQVRVYNADEWNGGGTVKVVVTDSNNEPPTAELIADLQEYLDPEENLGKGSGFAPIGHIVTAAGVNEQEVDVDVTVVLADGYTVDNITQSVKDNIEAYFDTLNAQWESIFDEGQEKIQIPVSKVLATVQDTTGVYLVKDITVQGTKSSDIFTVEHRDNLIKLNVLTITEAESDGT